MKVVHRRSRKLNGEDLANEVVRLQSNGLTPSVIARALGAAVAEVNTILGIPPKPKTAYQIRRLMMPVSYPPEPAPPKAKVNPLAMARAFLGRRVEERASGYFLDGVPANLDTIMREFNRQMVAQGSEQITHSDRWVV